MSATRLLQRVHRLIVLSEHGCLLSAHHADTRSSTPSAGAVWVLNYVPMSHYFFCFSIFLMQDRQLTWVLSVVNPLGGTVVPQMVFPFQHPLLPAR